MNPIEAAAAVTYINQVDPRVQNNDASADVWWYALASMDAEEAKFAIIDYYATANANNMSGVPPLNPATLKHRMSSLRERAASQQRALEPPARHTAPLSFRDRNPAEWDRLVQKGQDDYRAMLRSRDITPHTETCSDCQRDIRARAGMRTVENAY